jgi:GNAT superfamily N-acetyltransferase
MVCPSPEPVFLRARPEEAAVLSQLATAAQETWGFPQEQLDAWGELVHLDPGFFQTHVAWTLSRPSRLLGWGAWAEWGRRCRLEHLWICPKLHRQGFGSLLLKKLALAAQIRGWPAFEIVGEPGAEAFYRACGARRTGHLRSHPDRILDLWDLPLGVAVARLPKTATPGGEVGPFQTFTPASTI